MRAIDADALIDDCKRYLNKLNPDRDGKECTRIYWLIGILTNAPTIEPERKVEELLPDGTLHLFTDTDLSKVNRVLVSQNGTHYGDLYYADEERKTGKWIVTDTGRAICSECSAMYDWYTQAQYFDFCPLCGVRLEN